MALSYYRTGDLLRAKHKLATYDSGRRFEEWALRLVPIDPAWQVLDAGCGWGRFTWSLVGGFGVPAEQITCADRSHGMLLTLRCEAEQRPAQPRLCQASIEALPFRSRACDFAIAGHVLYHLDDITRGARELARVLRPDGVLLATTNADDAKVLVLDLHYQALEELGIPFVRDGAFQQGSHFSMEDGAAFLRDAFAHVEAYYFQDTTTFPDVATFMQTYHAMGRYRSVVEDAAIPLQQRERLAAVVEELAGETHRQAGVLRSAVLMGAFVCREPRDEVTM
jgi:ubiquinone/menaquinone biosynthesis C-methylase UbiE